jgi:uncharacterized integral membrane protein
MNARLIFALIIAILAIIMALQNPREILLRIGPGTVDTTVAVAIVVAFVLGLIAGYFGSVISRFDHRTRVDATHRDRPEDEPKPPTRLPSAAAE